jgi:hypothetical protein
MTKPEKHWRPETLAFNDKMKDALQQQHHAAQFLAMVGHHLVPQKADDSNTNMQYVSDKDMLVGHQLPGGLRIALHLTDLNIRILDKENNVVNEIIAEGKTKVEIFSELKQELSDLGMDVSAFKNKLHYEIPEHELDKGAPFSVKNKLYTIENSIHRHNAEIILNEVASAFEQSEPVRIWPHHFDTGTFIPVSRNEKGEVSQTIGTGWAIPDSMISEPYFYLSFWTQKPLENPEDIRPLRAGRWMMPDWKGAVLQLSEITEDKTAETQYQLAKSFFNQGIELLLQKLK